MVNRFVAPGDGLAGASRKYSNTCFTKWMAPLPFPDDLIRLQQQWTRTYNLLAVRAEQGGAELRRELVRLSCEISGHLFWSAHEYSAVRRVELRRAAETAPGGEQERVVHYTDGAFTVSDPAARP